jgi:predicted DNA-binding transcriptional regulator AlpA
MSSINFWFEHIIDAYLEACARGEDWRAACAVAQVNATKPRRLLTQKDLKAKKGISYSRQHVTRKVNDGTFPAPFQLPGSADNS